MGKICPNPPTPSLPLIFTAKLKNTVNYLIQGGIYFDQSHDHICIMHALSNLAMYDIEQKGYQIKQSKAGSLELSEISLRDEDGKN